MLRKTYGFPLFQPENLCSMCFRCVFARIQLVCLSHVLYVDFSLKRWDLWLCSFNKDLKSQRCLQNGDMKSYGCPSKIAFFVESLLERISTLRTGTLSNEPCNDNLPRLLPEPRLLILKIPFVPLPA